MIGHVLGKFSPDERPDMENALARAADAVQFALSDGLEAAANVYNVKTKSN
jgi:PTH1 family peptidyl-tRNA hydrolase